VSEPSTRDRNLAIADVLLRRAAVRSWPVLKSLMESDDDFAREVFLRAASRHSFGDKPFYIGLSERDIADVYVLTTRLFPRDENAEPATGLITAFDSIGQICDGIPRHLAGLGTEASVQVLRDLVADHPELSVLPYELSLAERTMRIATWSPLIPKEVLELTDKPTLKLVTSPSDLHKILVAALEKFAQELHGAQTPVRDLWDRQQGKDIFRPIDEPAISDVIARFLRAELEAAGVFANREVEIGRAPGAPVGERTDILINAVRRRADGEKFDPITAVIETKGCWNRELFTGLEAQLFRDYMIPLGAEIGIYLVPWFDTEKWDVNDRRRGHVPKITIEEVRARLEKQAAALPEGFLMSAVVFECRVPSASHKT